MGRRGPFRWGLALAVVLVAQQTLAGEGVCKSGCHGASQTFKYAQGTTYKYNYEGKIDITLSSAEGQVSSTEVKATVLLTQLADCNQLLRLQNVHILGANGKKYGHIPDLEKPIRINFQDGVIDDSICTMPGDTQNSLNIKRAIASLFQANYKNSHETDVFGLCPTEFAQHQEGHVLVIQKSRNLNKCAYRENIRQDFLSTVFNIHSEIKSSPILNGEYNVKLRIKDGILEQANAIENYLYVPFSVGKNGARAQVTSKIHLAGNSKENPTTQCSKPRSIIFDNPHPVAAPSSNINTILDAVKAVVKTIDVVVGEQTAKEFVTLIKTVRAAKKEDLLSVYNQVKSGTGFSDKTAAKTIFLDALLQATTADAAEVAITLLKSNEFNDIEKKLVSAGLSFVRHSSESLIKTATSLLDQRNLPYEVYLGIGNIAGRYCQQHSCDNVDAVNQLTQKLIQKLGDNKATSKDEETEMVYVLKSLANFGHLSDSVIQKIISIAQDKQAPNRLRVVALETYLSDPCKDKLRNSALNILQDIQQDSEIRIKAYLAVAQCPNAKVGNVVKALLEKEPSYQVGSFMVSHIRSVKASANPDKNLAKQFLSFSVPKRFPADFRKYSYNSEFSYAIDTLGLAASSESNVIYSQDSFLPRSASLNLTAEIFGHTFNFLELQTRQENLDRLIEHYFGPKGILKTSSLGSIFKKNADVASKTISYLDNKLGKLMRSRRDISKAEIDSIGKAVQIKENVLNKDLDLDLSVKAFGSEIFFNNFNMYQEGLTPEAIIDNIMDKFAEGLDKLKAFKETFRSNLILLDVEFDYPTGLGFPLRLAAEGTANIQVETEGNIDVRKLLRNAACETKIKLIPSANIEIAGRLTLDAHLVESGIKVVSTLYSATGGDLSINLSDKQEFDIKFGMPVKEQKILDANHEIVFHSREQAGPESNIPMKFAQQKDFSICIDQLSPFIGLAFCFDLNGPDLVGKQTPILPFPFAGFGKLTVTIEKEDLLYYHMKGFFNKNALSAEFLFEAIGKDNKKKTEFTFSAASYPQQYIKLVLNSPLKTAYAEARITNTQHEKSIMGKFGYDQNEFYGKLGISINGPQNKIVYKPIIEYKVPEGVQNLPVRVDGQIVAEETANGKKYTLDKVKVILPNGQELSVNGNFGAENEAFFTDLALSNSQASANIKGRLIYQPRKLLKLNAEFTNTMNPAVNFNVKAEVKSPSESTPYESSLQLIHGSDLSSKTNKLSISNKVENIWKGPGDYSYGVESELRYPLLGINAEYEFKAGPKSLEYEIDLQYNEIKLGSELDLELNKEHAGDLNLEFSVYGLDNKVKVKAERQVQGDTSIVNNELEVNGKKLEVKGKVKHIFTSGNVNIGADLTVLVPSHATPFKISSGLKYNPNDYDIHHKVTSGSTVVVDAFIKGNKQGNANGIFKVNIKDYLVVNGQVKATKGTGTADLLIDAKKVKQQIKFESTFKIQPSSIYNIDLTIYPSYDKDKNQQIKLSTHNKFDPTTLDSKSNVNVLGKKMELNISGKKTGNEQSGTVNGEVEVTLPNDLYILGKVSDIREHKDDLFNGNQLVSLEYRKNKNTSGRKLSLKSVYKNTNPTKGLYDVAYTLSADDSNGHNINGDFFYKRLKHGEEAVVELGNKIYGSLIQKSISGNFKTIYDEKKAKLDLTTSYGTDLTMNMGGSYSCEKGKPSTGDVHLQLSTPNKSLKTLNIEFSGSVLKPKDTSERLEIKGTGKIFADDDGSIPEPIIDFKGDGFVRASDKECSLQGNVNYGKQGPIAASAGYSINENGKEKQVKGNAALSYGQGKNFKLGGSLISANENQYKLETDLETPFENYRNSKFIVQTQRSTDQKHVTTNIKVITDGKQLTLDIEVQLSDISPLVNLKLKTFDGKTSQFFFKANTISEREFDGEMKITSEAIDFLFEGNLNANIDNIQNFFVKANVNSPTLKINKIFLEAHNKPGKGDRKIQITLKSAGNNLLSGTTTYQTREEQGKFIAEGTGSFKIKGESTSGNFKYVSQRLSSEKNGEDGIDVTMDINLGKRTFDAEYKLSDKQLRLFNSYCEKPKECSRIEINSKIKHNDVNLYDQMFEITVDLKKLGVPHDFNLKGTTQRKGNALDHVVDIKCNNGASKYKYNVYIHPSKAGISLTTPKRIVSLEANANIPTDITKGGKFSGDISFYFDKKNAPSKKASVDGWLNIDVSKEYHVNGEVKLNHPGIPRTLSIGLQSVSDSANPKRQATVTIEFDIFAQPSQKITSIYKASSSINTDVIHTSTILDVKSKGLGIDIQYSDISNLNRNTYSGEYTSKMSYHVGNSNFNNILSLTGSKDHINFLLKLLNKDILKVSSKLSISKEQQTIDCEVSSYDNYPVLSHLEIKNLNTLLFTIGYKNTPRDKLQFNAGLIPGQIADIRGEHITGSGRTNMLHATLHLEEANFLKPDFNVNSAEIEAVLEKIENSIAKYLQGLKELAKEWADIDTKELTHLTEISKALPNSTPIKQYYTSELDKIKNEFLEDKSLKELLEVLNNTFGAAVKSIIEILDIITDLVNSIVHSLQMMISGIVETIEKDVLPPIKELADKLTGITGEIAKNLLEILSTYLVTISKLIEKYQPQFKEIAAIFGEIGQDIARFIQHAYLQSIEIIVNLFDKVYNELKALPIYNEIKAQYDEFIQDLVPTIDGVIGGLREISATVKDLIPPEFVARPEIVEIIDLTITYIEKKLKQEPINDLSVLEKIVTNELSVFRKVLGMLSSPSQQAPNGGVPFTLDFLKNLPKLVAVRFSPIAYILKEDPSDAVVSFILSLINDPRRWVPPFPIYGIVIQGQNIFTFDGKLINFPGNCKYLLARDAVNGNFTLAGTYVNGNLNSITLADHHDTITIKKGGQVLLNNAATELPARKPDLAAYRDYEMIYLVSSAGITVSCLPDLDGCSIAISGFYHGQLKGLLGNGNNEPYDDLTIPNGKIVTKEAEFGNSYKIGNCQPVNVPKHDNIPEHANCKKLFDWESSLRLCYPFVNTENFKAACSQGKASKVKNTELLIAKAYVAACWEHSIPVGVPSNLLKCTNGDKPYDIGDTFSVKLPGKAADIVLIVDTLKENEQLYKEFFQPLVVEIAKSLQTKGISDVQFHLIGYGGENQWPSHITVGGKLIFKNKAPNLKFSHPPKEDSLRDDPKVHGLHGLYRSYIALFEDILYDFKLAIGQDLRARTFTEAYYYPFRANALKSIIVVNSKSCEVGRFFLLQKLRTILFKNNQISLNLITPLEELSLKDNKKAKDVIGFNDNQVFTISEAKKKPEGSAELYKDLDYDDFCVDFTIKNRGNVFGTNNFIGSKPDVKKQFVHVAAHNIVHELVNMEEGLDCECTQVSAYSGYNVCKEAYAKEKK